MSGVGVTGNGMLVGVTHLGFHHKRTWSGHREHAFARAWEAANESVRSLNHGNGVLVGLMMPDDAYLHVNTPVPLAPIDQREAAIVATVIQWLGSSGGMEFLRKALGACGKMLADDPSWMSKSHCELCHGTGRTIVRGGQTCCGWCRTPWPRRYVALMQKTKAGVP